MGGATAAVISAAILPTVSHGAFVGLTPWSGCLSAGLHLNACRTPVFVAGVSHVCESACSRLVPTKKVRAVYRHADLLISAAQLQGLPVTAQQGAYNCIYRERASASRQTSQMGCCASTLRHVSFDT